MKDIEKLKLSLKQAMEIAEANIEKAENIDLVDMAQTLESFIDELNDIGDFESYNELAEKLLLQKRAGIITEGRARKMMEVLDKNDTVQDNSFEKEFKYLEISPEKFKTGDLFLRAPKEGGEFFDHKEAIKILSITLPKDGRGNTAIIKTKEEGDIKLSDASLYNIARKK
jgi:hypothetical protein